MQNQVKTINVDELWMTGSKNVCSEYVLLAKIRRKYINNIEENIKFLSRNMKGTNVFDDTTYKTKQKILYLVDALEGFDCEELRPLAESNVSMEQFIMLVYEARKQKNKGITEECRD
tara:strand:- start:10047 stop:10397 length:351 start_codon:yes stop_codon:yes gene_type:complete